MRNIFTEHPHSVNETYWEHFQEACSFGFWMVVGGSACFIHAVFPFIFTKTASNLLIKMIKNLIDRAPLLEERILQIAVTIDEKKQTCDKC